MYQPLPATNFSFSRAHLAWEEGSAGDGEDGLDWYYVERDVKSSNVPDITKLTV